MNKCERIQLIPTVTIHVEEGSLKVRLLFKIIKKKHTFLLSNVLHLATNNTANVLVACKNLANSYQMLSLS